jgi:hypothetical protein
MKKPDPDRDAKLRKLHQECEDAFTTAWEGMIKSLNEEAHEKAVSEGYKGAYQEWSPSEGRKQLILFIYTNSGWTANHIAELTRTSKEFTHSIILNFNWQNPELARTLAKRNSFI